METTHIQVVVIAALDGYLPHPLAQGVGSGRFSWWACVDLNHGLLPYQGMLSVALAFVSIL